MLNALFCGALPIKKIPIWPNSVIPLLIQLINQPILRIAAVTPRPPPSVSSRTPEPTVDAAVPSPGRQASCT